MSLIIKTTVESQFRNHFHAQFLHTTRLPHHGWGLANVNSTATQGGTPKGRAGHSLLHTVRRRVYQHLQIIREEQFKLGTIAIHDVKNLKAYFFSFCNRCSPHTSEQIS